MGIGKLGDKEEVSVPSVATVPIYKTISLVKDDNAALELNGVGKRVLSCADNYLQQFETSLGTYLENPAAINILNRVFSKLCFFENYALSSYNPHEIIEKWVNGDFRIPDELHLKRIIIRLLREGHDFSVASNNQRHTMNEKIALEAMDINSELLISNLRVLFSNYGYKFRKIKTAHENKS